MRGITRILKNNFSHFNYFYHHLHYRIFLAFFLSSVVGVLDGFGLAMFFPLLQIVDGQSADIDGLGGLSFLISAIEFLGIELNLVSVLIIIATFFLLKGVMKFIEQYYNVLTRQYFIKKLRYDNVDAFSQYKYEAFSLSDSGRIQNTLSGEVEKVSQAYRNYFLAIQSGVLVVVYIGFALVTNVQFAVLVVIGGILSNIIYKQIYRKTKETSRRITKGGHNFQGLLIQEVAFFKYLKATNHIRKYTSKLKGAINDIVKSETKIGFFNSLLVATREPVVVLVVIIVILIQVSFFSESIGVIILSLLFFYRSLTSLVIMQNYWNHFLNVSGSLENVSSFMHELECNKDQTGTVPFKYLKNNIAISNVSYSYGSTQVLNNIGFNIGKNQTVAIIGESGSGKTTLINILSGLIPVNQGSIFIDGQSLESLYKPSYQNKIGYITQEPVIFSDSIYNNVTFWSEHSIENEDRFWQALKNASMDDFVKSLKDRENSMLGANGVLISGGQKQRLSIARELYKRDIEILIMDEATSSLDSQTENGIQQNIYALKGKYTIVIVAHRLSTIKNADNIVVLKRGEIEAVGTFQDLIQTSDYFKKMISYQKF